MATKTLIRDDQRDRLFMLPVLTRDDIVELECLRCLRLFWHDNPRIGMGLALVYWRALRECVTGEGWFD